MKSKWAERMEKTQKEKSIKKLQVELREEKHAEITRYVILNASCVSQQLQGLNIMFSVPQSERDYYRASKGSGRAKTTGRGQG